MEEQYKLAIQKIVRLAKENQEFGEQLRKELKCASSSFGLTERIDNNVNAIREALEIRANKSISYDFVENQRLRDQLIIDNLRMENAALDLKEDEKIRFYNFCVNAFYQIENIINYYFLMTYPAIDDLLTAVEQATLIEGEKYRFHRTGKEKTVSDIQIAHKLNAFCDAWMPHDTNYKITLAQLRLVRNEGEHRCIELQSETESTSKLSNFFKYNTFSSIRIALIKLVSLVKEQMV